LFTGAGLLQGAQTPPPASSQPKVRIAVIGVGGRGLGVLKESLRIGGVEVAALCDILPEAANRGVDMVQTALGQKPAIFTDGPTDYKRLLQRDDVDAVFVMTPTVWHGAMAADAIRARKWV